MKKLKVSIQDEQTLVLQEDGAKGDVIDLRTLHETDIDSSTITNVVNSIKKDAFNDALRKERETLEREMALQAKQKGRFLQSGGEPCCCSDSLISGGWMLPNIVDGFTC